MADTPMARVFTAAGSQTGEMALDPSIFGIEPNTAVMHQVVTAQRRRQGRDRFDEDSRRGERRWP